MRITATMIEQWADQPEAQGLLAVLIRRLIGASTELTELSIRGADTSNFAGWDGAISAGQATAWVPAGPSRWEWGVSETPERKANSDLGTRTDDTPADQASELGFVFVTPRIWAGKTAWRQNAAIRTPWREVRAYDADDLESWLETAGGVALWFGELLGIQGPQVRSVAKAWDTWRTQTTLPITFEAISTGRAVPMEHLQEALSQGHALLQVRADSAEEAIAIVSAQLVAQGLGDVAVCITHADGWAFVDANPNLRYLLAANAAVAAARAPHAGQCLIVPASVGDAAARNPRTNTPEVALERVDAQSFEEALVAMGEDPRDAARLARSCGRSWSVYRRRHARNATLSRPDWMQDPAAECLTAVVLVGAWNEGTAGDRACIEAVTGRSYELIERDLLRLSQLDDAPVLRIGNVWKAKAPLELLYLFAPQLTRDQIARFFDTAHAILAKPDPTLELEPERRWMASVYGRVREQSGIVIDSLVDSLTKLRVYAEDHQHDELAHGVDRLVRDLLMEADGARWLSLSNVLQEFAEASPEEFLRALDTSLRQPLPPVKALFSDRVDDAMTDRNYHVDLLWALEVLAWSPRHLARVCEALARLVTAPIRGNLTNRPSNSLASLLRPWWPQTTASAGLRLQVFDRLIRDFEDVAWDLLVDFLPDGHGYASANAAPRWRDYDAGAPGPGESAGFAEYMPALGQRVLDLAEGHAARIATLVRHLNAFAEDYRDRVIAMLRGAVALPDAQRQQVRDALREYLNRQFSYNNENPTVLAEAHRFRPLFDALAPDDLVLRHAWIFSNGWVDLPDGREDDYQQTDELRANLRAQAVAEIFDATGWVGLSELATQAETPSLVSWEIARADFLATALPDWVIDRQRAWTTESDYGFLRGLMHGLPADRRAALWTQASALESVHVIKTLLLASPFEQSTWTFVENLPAELRAAYWREIVPGPVLGEAEELRYIVDQLLDAGRHRAAFNALQFHPERVDSERLAGILEGIRSGADPEGGALDGWRIGRALAALGQDASFSRRDLAVLEYHYFEALRAGHGHQATTLFSEMSTDPALFMDVVSLAAPTNPEAVSASARTHAWSVLHSGRGMPGIQAGGVVDERAFFDWIDGVLRIAHERDLTDHAASNLGTWLSECPAEPEGDWPCIVVRQLLENPSNERIRNGFIIGVLNNRGVHSRAIDAGGNQERTLAQQFRDGANRLLAAFPRTAETLEDIARSYDRDARWHDNDAALWREGTR